MFSRIVAVVVQTIFFILVFAVGSFLPAIVPAVPMWRVPMGATHYFVWDGPLLLVLVFVLILIVEALTKRLRSSGVLTTISFILAFALALAAKLPFLDRTTM